MHFTRIKGWLNNWSQPVNDEIVRELEHSSIQAANALGNGNAQSYELLITRKAVVLSNPAISLIHKWKNRLTYIVQGKPIPISLFQESASGLIGPFAKSRKSSRSTGPIKENAIVFWPCPSGYLDPLSARFVLKVAVGSANHAREIRMLRMVSQLTGLTPDIAAYDPNLKWLVLNFIGNARRESPAIQANIYLDHIAEPYFRSWGIKAKSIKSFLAKKEISSIDMISYGEKLNLKNVSSLLLGKLSSSITHGGGICEECLLTDEGQPYLLDWEKATYGPIGEDLLQVFQHHPEKTIEYFKSLVTNDVLSPGQQLAISLILRFHRNSSKKHPSVENLRLDQKAADMLQPYL